MAKGYTQKAPKLEQQSKESAAKGRSQTESMAEHKFKTERAKKEFQKKLEEKAQKDCAERAAKAKEEAAAKVAPHGSETKSKEAKHKTVTPPPTYNCKALEDEIGETKNKLGEDLKELT